MPFDLDQIDDALGLTEEERRRAAQLVPFPPPRAPAPNLGAPQPRLQGQMLSEAPQTHAPSQTPVLGRPEANAGALGWDVRGPSKEELSSYGIEPMPAPASPLDRYRQLLGQEPQREQFPAPHYGTGKKILGTLGALGVALANPEAGGALATRIWHPEVEAERRYGRAHGDWEGRLGRIEKEATLGQRAAQIRNIESEVEARNRPKRETSERLDLQMADAQRAFRAAKTTEEQEAAQNEIDAIQAAIDASSKERTERQETPFSLWRKQHPNADVSEYFRLQPEARADVRGDRGDRETPAQRLAGQKARNLAETQKSTALARAESEIRRRHGLTGFAATSEWPQEAVDELEEQKQRIQDSYEQQLSNLGADVRHFEYLQQGQRRGANAKAAGQRLDRNNPEHRRIAAEILAEAGGDKEKAREIARRRNFRF